jgi:hypothetical protein
MTVRGDRLAEALTTVPPTNTRIALWIEAFLGFKVHSTCCCVPRDEKERVQWEKRRTASAPTSRSCSTSPTASTTGMPVGPLPDVRL